MAFYLPSSKFFKPPVQTSKMESFCISSLPADTQSFISGIADSDTINATKKVTINGTNFAIGMFVCTGAYAALPEFCHGLGLGTQGSCYLVMFMFILFVWCFGFLSFFPLGVSVWASRRFGSLWRLQTRKCSCTRDSYTCRSSSSASCNGLRSSREQYLRL